MPSQRVLRRERDRQRKAERSGMGFRQFEVRASSIDEKTRSVETVVTTESPVPMIDWERYEMVPEVLLTSGALLPASRQVPMLDSHQRHSMKDQLGSARELEKKDRQVVCRLYFSETAQDAFTKVREGHASDVSAGYQVLNKIYVAKGETRKIDGRDFTGPVNVVTKWKLREVSLTPIGADEQAKLRGLDPQALQGFEEEFAMLPALRTLCETRGMPKETSDDDAQAWLVANAAKLADPAGSSRSVDIDANGKHLEIKPGERASESGLTADSIAKLIEEGTRKAIEAADKKRVAFHGEIRSLCELADLPGEEEKCRTLADVAAVRAHLAAEKKKRADEGGINPAPHVRITGEGAERLYADMGTALSLRAVNMVAEKKETVDKVFPVDQRGKGHDKFRHMGIYAMAEESVRMSGIDTRGLTREQVALCAMFGPERAGLNVRSGGYGPASHTTGSFPKLTQDALNKSLMVGYTEAPSTWEGPMAQGASVSDFKTVHRIAMGGIPNLPVWPDNTDPNKASWADGEETYGVESRSLQIDYSYRLLMNDDMNALSRTPGQMGQAARRTVNAFAWSLLTGNPTMRDGQALLSAVTGNRFRKNLTTGVLAPSVANLNTIANLMRQMRGENTPENVESSDILGLQPRYIVGPSALDSTIKQLVLSVYDPAASQFMTYNTASELIPVIEPLLDANSTTAWYLFASPKQIDTIEVAFLQGQETPVARSDMDFKTLSQTWIILQTFGGKALNHRGIQRADNA